MVFRRENKADAFQRQISALRQQLTPDGEPVAEAEFGPADDRDQEGDAAPTYSRSERRPAQRSSPPDRQSFEGEDYGVSPQRGGYTDVTGDDQEFVEAAPSVPAIPLVDAQASVIAHDAVWSGDLRSDGSIHVHGTVEGTITSRQDVFVAEEADVDATINAVNIVVAGRVKGVIACRGRFEALPQGRIAADIRAPALVVHDGATITGGFRMGSAPESEDDSGETAAPPPPVVHRRAARGGD